jgi:hypothetical protein
MRLAVALLAICLVTYVCVQFGNTRFGGEPWWPWVRFIVTLLAVAAILFATLRVVSNTQIPFYPPRKDTSGVTNK